MTCQPISSKIIPTIFSKFFQANFINATQTSTFSEQLKYADVKPVFLIPELTRKAIDRSSHRRCSMKKDVLENFTKFTGKQLCQSLFLIKVAGLRFWHNCFPVNFLKFLRTPILQNTSGPLLLYRAISILPNVSKIYGKCLNKQFQEYFQVLLSKYQCGFR